jgi:hypothetical protein
MKITESMKDMVPSKTTVWTAVGASVLTIALGFTVGGWRTGNAAEQMAREAATAARVELAASVCAANFSATPAAFDQREEMLALPSFRQRSFVQEQAWALVPGETAVDRMAAERCAQIIADMEPEGLAVVDEVDEIPSEPEVDPG